ERAIVAETFFKGDFETALEPSELLVEIRIPIPAKGHGWSFQEVSQRKGDFALVAAGAMLAIDGGLCRDVRLGFRNVGETIFRLPAVEARIEGHAPSAAVFSAAATTAMNAVAPPSDLHADEAALASASLMSVAARGTSRWSWLARATRSLRSTLPKRRSRWLKRHSRRIHSNKVLARWSIEFCRWMKSKVSSMSCYSPV